MICLRLACALLTYGHNDVYGFFVPPSPGFVTRPPVGSGSRGLWKSSLDAPGALQMKHLRALIESHPFLGQVPDLSLLAADPGTGKQHVGAVRGDSYAPIYSPLGRPVSVRMEALRWQQARVTWFDPRTGVRTPAGTVPAAGNREFDPPGDPGDGNDWVLELERSGGLAERGTQVNLAPLAAGAGLGSSTTAPEGGSADRPVPLWGRFETQVSNPRHYVNPFTDVALNATFTSPAGRPVKFFGYYDGDGQGHQDGSVWRLRFMPDEPGTWSYTCSFSDGAPGARGTFVCTRSGALPGPLRVDPQNHRGWVFADGSHFWPRAYTAPELFVAGNDQHRKYWLDTFFGAKHRFNLCNANLLNFVGSGEVLNWQGTPYQAPDPARAGQYVAISGNGLFPFLYSGPRPRFDGGSNVDWLRPSIACWANVDQVLQEMEARRVVWFNHWGMIGWDWSGNGRLLVPSPARQAVLRYWVARLAPYWNTTWNLAGEWDELLTPAEFDDLGVLLRQADPWHHPLSAHALGTTADRPWIDFRIEQFSAGTSADAVANARRAAADDAGKPVFAFETSWEATPGKLTPDQVRRGAWGSVMGGAFYLYAECFEPTLTWGDGGAFPYVEIMHDFFAGLPYWRLEPAQALVNAGSLCLADRGHVYVIYRPAGGDTTLDLSAAAGSFRSEWMNPRTGARLPGASIQGGAVRALRAPGAEDWVLLVTAGPAAVSRQDSPRAAGESW
jgi:hypothetical protein